MSELTYRFRLLTGEILPSGWAVCPHKKRSKLKGKNPSSACHFNTIDFKRKRILNHNLQLLTHVYTTCVYTHTFIHKL